MKDSSPEQMMQNLLHIVSADADITQMIWNPISTYWTGISEEKILAFLEHLKEWKVTNAPIFQGFKVEGFLSNSPSVVLEEFDNMPFPPHPYSALPKRFCLVLALYSFFNGRLFWVLSISRNEARTTELNAYWHLYQIFRIYTTAINYQGDAETDFYHPCETLRVDFTPMLYLAGHCCPKPSWLRWIIYELGNVSKGGLCNSSAFATNLDILSSLEKSAKLYSGLILIERFPPPPERIITILLPELSGRHFVAFYATPRSGARKRNNQQYDVLCTASWSSSGNNPRPLVETDEAPHRLFSREWLMEQPQVKGWGSWSHIPGFDLDQALHNHISGSTLALEADS
ncbi:hypothetical protein AOR_1_2134 [Paecilomyces variotii No. 5]|uniref:Uncharacterized protein n=1 Tax=Byssochlamys spectabilis (strain No. 5 / NBRC 109023) TaxID=1356009 RepID=V5FX05_BYSSN|nr:hypothetical protein AOR_1_2134 [Paecilomyces variotii No. 5]